MKFLLLIAILSTLSVNDGFSQLIITKKNKRVSLDTNRIWGVNTNSVLLLSIYDFKYYSKRDKYKGYQLFRLDTVKNLKKNKDTLEFAARIIKYYRDTISNEIISNTQTDKEWRKGKFSSKPVFLDTTFHFAFSNIQQLKIQTRNYRHRDGLGIFGMFVMGTGVTLFSVVTVLQGNENGFYGLALGAGMLGLTKHWINQSRWLKEFKTTKNGWTIREL